MTTLLVILAILVVMVINLRGECSAGQVPALHIFACTSEDSSFSIFAEGVEYVKEAVAESREGLGSKEVTDLWHEHYRDTGYDL